MVELELEAGKLDTLKPPLQLDVAQLSQAPVTAQVPHQASYRTQVVCAV